MSSPGVAPLGRSLGPCELILEVLLPPCDRSKQITANDAEYGGQKLPDGHDDGNPWQYELDELICLVQVVLAGDIVFDSSFVFGISLGRQM